MNCKGIGLLVILAVVAGTVPAFASDLDRISITNPRLETTFGTQITDKVNAGQNVQISTDITNHQTKSQVFAYIVQIKDVEGLVVKVGWFGAGLAPEQKFTASRSWTPIKSGEYTAEIFVWEGLEDHNALTSYVKIPINVG